MKSFKSIKYVITVPFFQVALMLVFIKLYSINIQLTVTLLLFCWYLYKHGNKKSSHVNERNSTWNNRPGSVGLFWHLLYTHVHRHWNFPIYLITETFQITNNKKFTITQHDGKTGLHWISYVPNFMTFKIADT